MENFEKSWNGPIQSNHIVDLNFVIWQNIENELSHLINNNFRLVQALFRAYYDYYVKSRYINEKFYENILGLTKTHREVIPDQAIEAVLLNANNCEIELLKPIDDVSGVAKYLEKFGSKFHHLCFTVDEIEVELSRINNLPMELIDKSPRKGLVGEVAFIHPKSTNGILVEVAQPKDQEITQNPIHINEVILKNNNNSIIQNWNNLLLNHFQAISAANHK